MRFLAATIVLALCFVGLPGCALFKKSTTDAKPSGGAANPGGPAPAQFPGGKDPLLNGGNVSANKPGAVLAGRVLDPYGQPPANTFIRLVSVDAKESSPSSEVAVTPEGYFTIQGLKPGGHYKLVTRGKTGDKTVASITYHTAPNVRVLIQVREDFANSSIPDTPGAPAFQPKKEDPKTSALNKPFGNTPTLGTPHHEGEVPAVQVPTAISPNPAPNPGGSGWTPGIAKSPNVFPPTLEIANPQAKPQLPPLVIPKQEPTAPPPQPFPGNAKLESAGPARVPSCVLVGKQLVNFALNDVNGEPWEFRAQRRGKVVLLDFWSTTCVPCLQTAPALRQLQAKYGHRGLEIIGIANEADGSQQEQAYKVNAVSQKLQTNYRQLLSGGSMCPVRGQLGVRFVPTLVLVDENGWILWRHEGRPDRNTLDELERVLQRKI